MKAKNAGRIISTLIAAAMISMTAVSAAAVDYSSEGAPTDEAPAPPSVLTDDDIIDAVEKSSENGEDETSIPMDEDEDGNAVVQEAAIAEIAKSGVTVTIDISDQNGHDYSVTIDPALIEEAKAINIAVDIEVTENDTDISDGTSVPPGAVVIKPMQKGSFGMTLKINLPPEDTADIDPDNAMLFYAGDDGSIELMPDGSLIVNSDGSMSVLISHASSYIITDTDLLAPALDEDDEDDEDDIDRPENDDSDSDAFIDDAEDENPSTGVALAAGAAASAAAAVLITAKRKKR